MSKIEEKVIEKIRMRAEVGEKKYNTTMERTDLTYDEWLQHLQEELLDACVYLEKLMELTKRVGISRKIDDRGNFPLL
tara:strand:+ start:728 stop:961 length:234 start_codon:yes stop_codon:yes gene_type:complete